MRIGLFGYGKMGKMIEGVALERGHSIGAKIDVDTQTVDYTAMDVAIDFSTPEAAFDNITNCFRNGVPVISGTTGWLSRYGEAVEVCERHGGAFIHATNFSLGVNIFFELNAQLAKMMSTLDRYRVHLEETHHIHKLDAPSGTAITLAEGIIDNSSHSGWELDAASGDKIPIKSFREGEVPGTHRVFYESSVDRIEIGHIAHNRQGFALGAVVAAEWILGKKGVHSMKDVLNL